MAPKTRVCAVSYLNTAPLVWGLSHGPQQGVFDLSFELPAVCADNLREASVDVGLIPIIELARQPDTVVVPGCSIACEGPVRSILLLSKKPFDEIESFAADIGSRTSVVLTQIIAARKHGLRPRVRPYPPRLDEMLELADAALVIGDAALRLDPKLESWRGQPVHVYDLGAEWTEMTSLPMVFAVWAAKKSAAHDSLVETLNDSASYGRKHIEEIISVKSERLDFPPEQVRAYLTKHIRFGLGERERDAMRLYLRLAAELGLVDPRPAIPFLAEQAVAG